MYSPFKHIILCVAKLIGGEIITWIVAVGVPVALFVWFTIAYFLKIDVNNPTVGQILVDFNISLWAIIAMWRISKEFRSLSVLKLRDPVKAVEAGIAIALLLGVLNFVFEFWPARSYNFPGPYSSLYAFVSFLLGSILEEVIWRAYVLKALGAGFVGLTVSSLFFGLHHLGLSFKHFVFATIAGLVFGAFYIRTGLFWAVALGHVLYNLVVSRVSDMLFEILIGH